jgi:hypothetical protein
MCTRASPYGRVGRCGFDGRGVTLCLFASWSSSMYLAWGKNSVKVIESDELHYVGLGCSCNSVCRFIGPRACT